jgi:integrase
MGTTARRRIGVREVRALKPGETVWDAAVTGFGARRQRSEAVSFFVAYRTRTGRQRWHTIGRFGAPWMPETARREAQQILGEVAEGRDPAAERHAERKALSVADLCDSYLEAGAAGRLLTRRGTPKRARTLDHDRGRIERHIKPLIGALPAAAVTTADVERFMHRVAEGATKATVRVAPRAIARVRGGRAAASRAVVLLGAIFAWGERQALVPGNPARGVRKFADVRRERRLTDDEYAAFGAALRTEARISPFARAALRFAALSGWRRSEIAGLRWREIDLARRTATLAETKTGRSLRPLSNAACEVLRGLPRGLDDAALVFPASPRSEGVMNMNGAMLRIAKRAGLPADLTPHVLRHSFASVAADLGYGEAAIGAMLGHAGGGTTRRYVHHADAVLLAAADAVADRIAELMGDAKPGGVVVAHPRAAGVGRRA